MNKYLTTIFSLFVFITMYDCLVHGLLLMPLFDVIDIAWHNPLRSQSFVTWLIGIQILLAFIVSLLFSRSDSTRAVDFSVFGVLVGLFFGLVSIVPTQLLEAGSFALITLFLFVEAVKFGLAGLIFFYVSR